MTISTLTNIITILFCSAVLVQSVRLIRCLREMKADAFAEMVAALDQSTIQARSVLADLRETLQVDCAANARVIASGAAMREELTVMSGIADAVAERIVEAVEKSTPRPARTRAAQKAVSKDTPKLDGEPVAKMEKRARAPRAPIVEPLA